MIVEIFSKVEFKLFSVVCIMPFPDCLLINCLSKIRCEIAIHLSVWRISFTTYERKGKDVEVDNC